MESWKKFPWKLEPSSKNKKGLIALEFYSIIAFSLIFIVAIIILFITNTFFSQSRIEKQNIVINDIYLLRESNLFLQEKSGFLQSLYVKVLDKEDEYCKKPFDPLIDLENYLEKISRKQTKCSCEGDNIKCILFFRTDLDKESESATYTIELETYKKKVRVLFCTDLNNCE